MSDAETTARLRTALASGRVRADALLQAEQWDDLAELTRSLARMERELALLKVGLGAKPEGIVTRRVPYVRG